METSPVHFLLGFAAGFLTTLYLLVNSTTQAPQALAEAPPIETQSPTPSPEPTPTPKPKTSSPKPIATPSPTPSPVPTATPVPVPTSTPDVWSPEALEPIFSSFAGQFGVDKNILERLANCESHFNPNASNGPYGGMFQFSSGTWQTYRSEMGEDTNPALRFDANESIKTAAYGIATRGTAPWPSCI